MQNYASSSNNNLFLGANLMNNGTAYSLAAFKTIVSPRDAASISEVPVFFSTVGANATYLHVNGATNLESGERIFLVIPMTLMVIFDKGIVAIVWEPLLIWEPMSLADCQMIKAHLLFHTILSNNSCTTGRTITCNYY
jgi:hypothetical protein